jgi:TRAP-type mannitol/chloroaromatic compound transport system substrate-binding protein
VLERLRTESAAVSAEMASDNELARRIHASYTHFLEDVRSYHAISEQAYINAR